MSDASLIMSWEREHKFHGRSRTRFFKRQLLHAPFSAECPVMRLMTRKYTLPLAKSTQTFKEMRLSYSGKYGDPRDLSILL